MLKKLHKTVSKSIAEALKAFDNRNQQRNENVYSFGLDLIDLAKSAYPDADENQINTYVKHQFIKGLRDGDVQKKVAFNKTGDLNALMDQADEATNVLNSCSKNEKVSYRQEAEPPRFQRQYHPPVCNYCQKPGHTQEVCRVQQRQQQQLVIQPLLSPQLHQRQLQNSYPRNNNLNNNGVSVLGQSRLVVSESKNSSNCRSMHHQRSTSPVPTRHRRRPNLHQ